jgi:hypothetical protein
VVEQLRAKISAGHQQLFEVVRTNKALIERLVGDGRGAVLSAGGSVAKKLDHTLYELLSLLKTDRCQHFHVCEPLIVREQREWLTLLLHQERIHANGEKFRDVDGKMDKHVLEVRGAKHYLHFQFSFDCVSFHLLQLLCHTHYWGRWDIFGFMMPSMGAPLIIHTGRCSTSIELSPV